ncbi:branched-chain amino acid aminotransferase II [Imleria badia]|nr:branched-chain amino acid aminotransferase II [Imleria badia]
MSKLIVRLTDAPKPLPDLATVQFGTNFSDHMAVASFHPASGWSQPEIKPYAPFMLDPASSCFQYGYNAFEGMKAYLGPDGKVRLFRPDLNMRRFERSVARLALPPIDGDAILELIKRLVQTEKRWVPTLSGDSLYLRPTVIATRPAIGTVASDYSLLFILACPCRPYFPRPVSLLAMSDVVRAWPGGTGADKIGSNYAPGFLPQREAVAQGYDHVLWLFGEERRVTEGGVMNVFVVVKREDGGWDVLTPPLDGMILPGVTRASCLALLSDPAFRARVSASVSESSSTSTDATGPTLHPTERTFTLSDLERWFAEGTLLEIFLVGTAAIVAATHQIGFDGRVVVRVPTHTEDPHGLGPVGSALREKILAVQEGREEYEGWGVVCE